MIYAKGDNMKDIRHQIRQRYLVEGFDMDRGEWQSVRDERPQTKTFEVHDVSLEIRVGPHIGLWQSRAEPNLPWAEDHFGERISPDQTNLNPGTQYMNWPWYEQGVEEHKQPGQFSHTYMERFWPRYAIHLENSYRDNKGIRFKLGDFGDLLELIGDRPYTRQAYLPIWFPEDLTAAREGERVPCTLGYHFQGVPNTEGGVTLNVTYYMRSCDWYRYLNDDVYMAGRLLQAVSLYGDFFPGKLTMHIANLHIFQAEKERLAREHDEETQQRMTGII